MPKDIFKNNYAKILTNSSIKPNPKITGIYTKIYSKNHFMPKSKSKIYFCWKIFLKYMLKNDVKIRFHSIQLIPKKSNFYIKGLSQRTLGILNPEIIMVFGISGWQLKTFLRHLKDTFFTFSNYHSDFIQIRHSVQLGFCIFRYRFTQK